MFYLTRISFTMAYYIHYKKSLSKSFMGPIMLDVHGTSLTDEDREIIQHPMVGGLIYFSRNFESHEQVAELSKEIRAVKQSDLLIAVDHEGGRVQRFRDGFSAIPAMGAIYPLANNEIDKAKELAEQCGILMALEVQAVGIDISFAPILDIDNISDVIGDRAFHQGTEVVTLLASAFINGMRQAGMAATGKHFPGHGSVKEDSHIAMPIDNRSKEDILANDFFPFEVMIKAQQIAALMPAHVVFPAFDDKAVGFSRYWLQEILRKKLAFDGVIFSDDLSMEGAHTAGGFIERSEAAQQAGCDMLLLCNNRPAVIDVIDKANLEINKDSSRRLQQMLRKQTFNWTEMTHLPAWHKARMALLAKVT